MKRRKSFESAPIPISAGKINLHKVKDGTTLLKTEKIIFGSKKVAPLFASRK